MTAQGSQLISRAGSSSRWMECTEGDFSEVLQTVQAQCSWLSLCPLLGEKIQQERKGVTIIMTHPFFSFFPPLSATRHHFSSALPPRNGGGNGCLAEEMQCTEIKCSETTSLL